MEELDLKELFLIFWNKKLEIILITLVAIVIGVIYSYFYVVPEYKSATTLVLAQSSASTEKNTQGGITQSDISLNSNLVSTYSELIKSKSVLRQVASNLEMKESQVNSGKITVKAKTDTEVIEITVRDKDPNTASLIANEISKVFTQKVVEIYNISNIYIIDKAEPTSSPFNINHKKDLVIFAFIGLVVSAAFVLLLNMLDTTIKSEVDVEKCSGLLVLSSIPNYNIEPKKKGGRRS